MSNSSSPHTMGREGVPSGSLPAGLAGPIAPRRPEINHHTLKLIVGFVALSLPGLTNWLAGGRLTSISESYHAGGSAQTVFTGFLFAIAAFLFAYNGRSATEKKLAKVAAIGALGVALFPCCGDGTGAWQPKAHWLAAAALFLVLAKFCHIFWQRARTKPDAEAQRRAVLYAVCGIAMIAAIGTLAIDAAFAKVFTRRLATFTYHAEAAGLYAFGLSWLAASKTLPWVTSGPERFVPFRAVNPD